MKKILLVLVLFVAQLNIDAQKPMLQNENAVNQNNTFTKKVYYDGVVYVRLKAKYQKSASQTKNVDMLQEAPFLKNYQSTFGLSKLEKPFYFAKNKALAYTYRLYFKANENTEELMQSLKNQEEVEYVERVPIAYIPENYNKKLPEIKKNSSLKSQNVTVNDPYYGNTAPIELTSGTLTYGTAWFLDQINAPSAWGLFTPQAGNPIKVAVVDGAVYKDHPDLNVTQSYDAETQTNNSNPPAIGDAYEWSHGTHCAGLISATTNNSVGIPSIGQNLEIIGVKTGQNSDGSLTYFYDGMLYAIEQSDAKVMSLSVGSYGFSLTEQSIINEAYEKDIVVLAAASNDDISDKSYPAAYDHVIAVGSVSADDKKSDFSNFGDWVDVMAPGGNLTGTYYLLLSTTYADAGNQGMGIEANSSTINGKTVEGKYHMMAGTSMATPVAAGLVGLMRAADPTLNADQIEAILKRSCDNIDALNPNYIGYLGTGRINAFSAIQTIQQGNSLISVPGYSSLIIGPSESIQFTDKSIGSPNAWEWTFEGPETLVSTDQNPSIQFNTVGDYTARLVVFNATSSDTSFITQKIKVGTSTNIEIESTSFTAESRGISFISVVDQNTVWALAYDGANTDNDIQEFTVTSDGGKTWTARNFNLPSDISPSMIFGISETTAWAPFYKTGTSPNGIYKTINGGNTWSRQSTASFSGTGSFPNVVYFWNENEGVCMGDPDGGYFELYTTSDGGTTWTRVPNTGNVLNSIAADEYGTVGFYSVGDDGSFFFNTNKGRVFSTNDKGASWKVNTSPINTNNKIAFSDANYGIMVNLDNDAAYFTEDGGTTWNSLIHKGEFFSSHFIYVPGSKNMFASAGANYNENKLGLTLSTDGGKTWKDIPELTDQQCLAIGFSDITTGWIGQFSVNSTTGGMLKYQGPSTFSAFESDEEYACVDQSTTITFTNKSSTAEANPSYFWDFGPGATPATANTEGPHTVSYNSIGSKSVNLTVNDYYKSSTTVKINEPAILGTVLSDTNRVCQGANVSLSLTGTSGDLAWQRAILQDTLFTNSQSPSSNFSVFESEAVEDTTYFRVKVFSLGCNELISDTFKIDVSRINADFSWSRDSFTVDFMDLSENATTYLWNFGDGESSTESSPSHRYASDNEYEATYIVYNDEACADSTTQTVTVNVTGIENTIKNAELKLYPNPNNGQFYIELNSLSTVNSRCIISDINGKIISENNYFSNKFTVDLTKYKSGIYFLKIITDEGSASKKIIIR